MSTSTTHEHSIAANSTAHVLSARGLPLKLSLGLALGVVACPLLAHPGHDGVTASFAQGLVHPLSGLDHLFALVAVGAWAALRGGSARWLAPLTFLSAMACGLALSHVVEGVSPKGLEAMVGGSLIALGALLVMHQRIYGAFALGLIGATAFAHGVAHARELPPHAVAGVLLATLALHAAGIALGLALRSRTRAAGMLVGGATAALGSALLAGLA